MTMVNKILYYSFFSILGWSFIRMVSLAQAIANHTPYGIKDIYLHTHIAEKDQLFIMGDIVTNWKHVGGPDTANKNSSVS